METIGLMLRIAISLVAVLGLMWLLARAARKPLGKRATRALSVLARTPLSKHATVAVVKVGDKALVLGVTDSRITLLGETDPDALVPPVAAAPTSRTPIDLAIADEAPVAPDAEVAVTAPAANAKAGALAGSALSPKVWGQALEVLRERTARRA